MLRCRWSSGSILLACLTTLASCVMGNGEVAAAPVTLRLQDVKGLAGVSFNAVAMSADGHRLYLGRLYNYDPKRLNLIVATLDDNHQVTGEARPYIDSDIPLGHGTQASITANVS